MHRLALSILGGFILIYCESLIIMQLHGYSSLEFGNLYELLVVWFLNVFILYSMLFSFGKRSSAADE